MAPGISLKCTAKYITPANSPAPKIQEILHNKILAKWIKSPPFMNFFAPNRSTRASKKPSIMIIIEQASFVADRFNVEAGDLPPFVQLI